MAFRYLRDLFVRVVIENEAHFDEVSREVPFSETVSSRNNPFFVNQ